MAWPPNGLELSGRASRIRFRIDRFSAAGPVSCSELLGCGSMPISSSALFPDWSRAVLGRVRWLPRAER
jgi:hypothetical protein